MIDLIRNAEILGTDYGEFCSENNGLAASTQVIVANGRDITLLSVCEIETMQEPESTTFWVISDANLRSFRKYNRCIPQAIMRNNKVPEALLAELKATTGLMFLINGEKYLVDQHAMPTLSQQTSVGGTMTLQRANFVRDMHLADGLFQRNEIVTIVYRENEDGIKKIFAVFAGAYRAIPQTVVQNIANFAMNDEIMGEATVKNWSICHSLTELNMVYPKIKDMYTEKYGVTDIIPGITIRTSDVGDCAVTVYATQHVKGSYVITEELTAKHTKKNENAEDLISKIDEKIFFEHRKLPELLAELIGKEVESSKVVEILNDAVEDLLKDVLTKRHIQGIMDSLKLEINPAITYTLYDLAIRIMELPDQIQGVDDARIIKVRQKLSKTPEVLGNIKEVFLTA